MADTNEIKKLVSFDNLASYDTLIKKYIGDADAVVNAKSIKTILWDATNEKIKFFKKENATLADTADYEVSVASSDVDTLKEQMAEVQATLTGYDKDNTVADAIGEVASDLSTLDTEFQGYKTATDGEIAGIKGRLDTVEGDCDDFRTAIGDLETAVGDVQTLDTDSKEVVGAINELKSDLYDAVEAGEVSIVEATGTGDVLKSYTFYQGEQKETNKIGTINIPKDLVVTSGEVVKNPEGQPAGTYIKLTIANQEAPIFINVLDLVNDFTVEQNASQVQLAISDTREISAEIVDGSVDTDALGAAAVTTAKIADANVTKAKLSADVQATLDKADAAEQAIKDAIDALDKTVTQTAGADGVAAEVVQEDGLLKSVTVSIATNTYDAYGEAAKEAKKVQDDLDTYKYDVASETDINGLFGDSESNS